MTTTIEESLGLNFEDLYEYVSYNEGENSVRHGLNSNENWHFVLENSQRLYDKSDDLSTGALPFNMEDKLYEGSDFKLCHYMGHLAEIRLKFKSSAGESVAYHMVR